VSLSRILSLLPITFVVSSVLSADTFTIDFATLGGSNGALFSTYTENGFTVSSTAGAWNVAQVFGNPIPDVFCMGCTPGTLEVTGGLFSFDSVDIGNASFTNGAFNFTITGFLGGNQVLTQTGNSPARAGTFETVNSADSSKVLDSLFISINTLGSTDGNVDNIVLTSSRAAGPVPKIRKVEKGTLGTRASVRPAPCPDGGPFLPL
jgi:hypothetical protein